jgi:hypothetical protein
VCAVSAASGAASSSVPCAMSAAQRASAQASLANEDDDVKSCLLPEGERLEAPIPKVADKWKLLPAFLKVRPSGLRVAGLSSTPHTQPTRAPSRADGEHMCSWHTAPRLACT